MSFFFKCGSADDIIEQPVPPPGSKSKSYDADDNSDNGDTTASGKVSTGGRKKTPPKKHRKKKSFHGSDDPITTSEDDQPVRTKSPGRQRSSSRPTTPQRSSSRNGDLRRIPSNNNVAFAEPYPEGAGEYKGILANTGGGSELRQRMQKYVPYHVLNEEEALQLSRVLQAQEARYGFNMFQVLTPTDQTEINALMKAGNKRYEDAVYGLFERRYNLGGTPNVPPSGPPGPPKQPVMGQPQYGAPPQQPYGYQQPPGSAPYGQQQQYPPATQPYQGQQFPPTQQYGSQYNGQSAPMAQNPVAAPPAQAQPAASAPITVTRTRSGHGKQLTAPSAVLLDNTPNNRQSLNRVNSFNMGRPKSPGPGVKLRAIQRNQM